MTQKDTPMDSPIVTKYPDAPIPTKWTRFSRQNPIIQLGKFLGLSGNVMMMVIKGHDS